MKMLRYIVGNNLTTNKHHLAILILGIIGTVIIVLNAFYILINFSIEGYNSLLEIFTTIRQTPHGFYIAVTMLIVWILIAYAVLAWKR